MLKQWTKTKVKHLSGQLSIYIYILICSLFLLHKYPNYHSLNTHIITFASEIVSVYLYHIFYNLLWRVIIYSVITVFCQLSQILVIHTEHLHISYIVQSHVVLISWRSFQSFCWQYTSHRYYFITDHSFSCSSLILSLSTIQIFSITFLFTLTLSPSKAPEI